MQVPGKYGVRGVHLRVMAGSKRANQIRLIDHLDLQLRRRVARTAVMVTAHQHTVQAANAGAPAGEGLQHRRRAGLGRMQKISQKHQLGGLVMLHQLLQAAQVFAGGARWHRLAQCAVSGGFAHVQVGYKQHALRWPPHCVFGQQPESLPGVVNGQGLAQGRRIQNIF